MVDLYPLRTIDLAQKGTASPATAANNLKEIEEMCAEAIRTTVEADVGAASTITSDPTMGDHGHDSVPPREDDAVDQLAVCREAAESVGITDPEHVEGFLEMYAQMSNMDSNLTPQQLSKYTEHSLRQLGIGGDADGISMMDDYSSDGFAHYDVQGQDDADSLRDVFDPRQHASAYDDTGERLCMMNDHDTEAFTATRDASEALAATRDAHTRLELYDTGATNMFRQKEHDAVVGSVRKLVNPRSVTTADKGVVASRTYIEVFNMLTRHAVGFKTDAPSLAVKKSRK